VDGERDAEEIAELAVEVACATLGVLDGADDDLGQGAESLLFGIGEMSILLGLLRAFFRFCEQNLE